MSVESISTVFDLKNEDLDVEDLVEILEDVIHCSQVTIIDLSMNCLLPPLSSPIQSSNYTVYEGFK